MLGMLVEMLVEGVFLVSGVVKTVFWPIGGSLAVERERERVRARFIRNYGP